VKQRCESNEFIVIIDDLEMFARDFLYQMICAGREQGSRETERERECVRAECC